MARIVVIGSVAGDEVVESAGPLRAGAHLNGRRAGVRLGGVGANTSVALAAAGHPITLLAAVGQDAIGEALRKEQEEAGVDTTQVVQLAGATSRSLVVVGPEGERTVANVARCEEAGPPTRLLALCADAVYVRSRRGDLAPLLARKASDCLVVAHVPPVDPGLGPRRGSSPPPLTWTGTWPTIRWRSGARWRAGCCAGSS